MALAVESNASQCLSNSCTWQSSSLNFHTEQGAAVYAKRGRRLRLTNNGPKQRGLRRSLLANRSAFLCRDEASQKPLGGWVSPFPASLTHCPYPSPLLPLKSSYGVWGRAVSSPKHGLVGSPNRSRIWCISALKYDIWWQQFYWFSWESTYQISHSLKQY